MAVKTQNSLRALAALAALFLTAISAHAKLAAERWTRLTEEERHQLTRAERYVEQSNYKSALAEYELFLQLEVARRHARRHDARRHLE